MITEEGVEIGIYTETLARLYRRQGFLDKALTIYQHLACLQPHQTHLQTQIQELEEHMRHNALVTIPASTVGSAPPAFPSPAASLARPERARAQTTRRVLMQLEKWLHYLQQQPEPL